MYHPHVHIVTTGGGLTELNKWVEKEEDFFIPVKVMSSKFRGKFLYYLKKEKIDFYGSNKYLENPTSYDSLIQEMYDKDWIVYCKEPFKNAEKLKKIKFFSELGFFYLPQSWAFNTNMHRTFTHLKMRDFNTTELGVPESNEVDLTFSKDFTWDRNFDFKYDLTKNLKFTFQTAMNSTVEEGYYTPEVLSMYEDLRFENKYYEAWKDTIQRSMATWGTPYTYQQVFSASWNVPFNRIPYLEALNANASYNATYNGTFIRSAFKTHRPLRGR